MHGEHFLAWLASVHTKLPREAAETDLDGFFGVPGIRGFAEFSPWCCDQAADFTPPLAASTLGLLLHLVMMVLAVDFETSRLFPFLRAVRGRAV